MRSVNSRRFAIVFIKSFIVLFIILVVLPFIVEQVLLLFDESMVPRNNSIIVFKDLVKEQKVIARFIDILKKIIIFM
jgi:hypothetical protein